MVMLERLVDSGVETLQVAVGTMPSGDSTDEDVRQGTDS